MRVPYKNPFPRPFLFGEGGEKRVLKQIDKHVNMTTLFI